jgi:hypothetical protein
MSGVWKLIDKYVLFARVAPVAVVGFTLFLAISAWIPFSEWPIKLLGGSAFLAIGAFVLAQLTRDAGQAIQGPIWESWGGPPTVRMLQHRDTTFAPSSKASIHRHLVELGVAERMPTEEEERQSPQDADVIYLTCSDWLRRKALELKSKSPFDVVHSENIFYGFRRNSLGIKSYGLTFLGVAFAVTAAAFFFGRQPYIELCGVVLVGTYLIFGVTEAAMRRAADDYSKRLLDAAQAISVPKKAPPRTRASSRSTQQG